MQPAVRQSREASRSTPGSLGGGMSHPLIIEMMV
jgi:hypothetical protein